MPPPFIASLGSRARSLLPIIQSGVSSGLGSRAINDAIRRATGTGLRRQTLLDIMRQLRGIEEAGERLRFVRRDRTPDPTRVPEALTSIRRRFGSTVRIEGVLADTGERITQHVQVTHDEPLTRGELEDTAAGFIEDDPEGYGILIDRVLLVRQIQRAA